MKISKERDIRRRYIMEINFVICLMFMAEIRNKVVKQVTEITVIIQKVGEYIVYQYLGHK